MADIQNVLGRPEARPKAPFPFANTWGSNLSLFLPFFLVAWFRQGRRWQRYAAPLVLVVAAIPIIYSLNRGLWVSLALGVVGVVLLQLRKGRAGPIIVTAVVLVVVTVALLPQPAGHGLPGAAGPPAQQRPPQRAALAHGHQHRRGLTGRRASAAPATSRAASRRSRARRRPDCSACGVPPLGTQGHIWGVIFSQGLVGALLFLSFFVAGR